MTLPPPTSLRDSKNKVAYAEENLSMARKCLANALKIRDHLSIVKAYDNYLKKYEEYEIAEQFLLKLKEKQ